MCINYVFFFFFFFLEMPCSFKSYGLPIGGSCRWARVVTYVTPGAWQQAPPTAWSLNTRGMEYGKSKARVLGVCVVCQGYGLDCTTHTQLSQTSHLWHVSSPIFQTSPSIPRKNSPGCINLFVQMEVRPLLPRLLALQ